MMRMRTIIAIAFIALTAFSPAPRPAEIYDVEVLTTPAPLKGANGMEFNADGDLIVASMAGQSLYKVDVATGAVEVLVGPPKGIADDIAIGPGGMLAWTSLPQGIVRGLAPSGQVQDLATGLPGINSINFSQDGRLFAAQFGPGGGNLYEIDTAGQAPPRLVKERIGSLNGFEINQDNILFGPLVQRGKVVRIDLDTGAMTEIASGLPQPTAVNLDAAGNIYVVDYFSHNVTRIDPKNGEKHVVATVDPPTDNLAISDSGLIYISHGCDNGIEEIDPSNGKVRTVIKGSIGRPAGAVLMNKDGRETLLVASMLCQNLIDTETGGVSRLPRSGSVMWSSWLDRKDGVVVITDFFFGLMQWLDADTGALIKTVGGFNNPYAVKIMDDASVIVAESGAGKLLRLPSSPSAKREVIAEELEGPVDFVFANKGIVYITEANAGLVSEIRLSDGARRVIHTGIDQPEGIDLLADGRIVVAEVGAKRLIAFAPSEGAQSEPQVLAENLPIGLTMGEGQPAIFVPTDVVVSAAGAIYVTSDIDQTVLKLTPRKKAR